MSIAERRETRMVEHALALVATARSGNKLTIQSAARKVAACHVAQYDVVVDATRVRVASVLEGW